MSNMNKTKKSVLLSIDTGATTTRNHEGSVVHNLKPIEVLFSKVLGSFFGESTHYEKRTAEEDFVELVKTINELDYEDREYALKIALLGREYNMIQYPLAVLTACFNDERFKGQDFLDRSGKNKLQYYSNKIIRRGKDITDVLAMQIAVYGFDRVPVIGNNLPTFAKSNRIVTKHKRDLPLPIQLRKALKYKLESFNEYQLSKALGESKDVSLADAIKLLHPNVEKSRVRHSFYKDVIEGRVKFADDVKQVQSELANSRNKNSESTLKDVKNSIDASTVMAIVKNLVALERTGAFNDSRVVDSVVAKLTDKKQVQSSRLLPFRFYSAWKEVTKLRSSTSVRRISDALVEALDLSIDNLQTIEGFNAIIIDRSGSMRCPISGMSDVTADEVSAIMGAICFKKGIGDVYLFANEAVKLTQISSKSTIMDITNAILRTPVVGGTYLDKVLKLISNSGVKYDNLIMFSDNDCYSSNGKSFKLGASSYHYQLANQWDEMINSMIRANTIKKFYLNNMLGNTFAIVNTNDYRKNLITGFSERVVDVINVYSSIGQGASDVRKVIDSLVTSLQKK